MGAKILRADLTADGMDATKFKTITSFPTVHDVTGLTVDYSDDRLYWTDFLGSAAVVSSSDLDGNNVVQHFHRTGSVFWGVDTFDHYLYVTDIYPKFMNEGTFLAPISKILFSREFQKFFFSADFKIIFSRIF